MLPIFVSLLTEPLARTGPSRNESDTLTIKIVLHLIRNLVSPHPGTDLNVHFSFVAELQR